MEDSLLLSSIFGERRGACVVGWRSTTQREAFARMSAQLDQVEAENCALRREMAELRCEVSYWKSRHAYALLRIKERDVLIGQLQAEVKQLKSRQFGRQSEKSSGR